jgi:hypothetical protein
MDGRACLLENKRKSILTYRSMGFAAGRQEKESGKLAVPGRAPAIGRGKGEKKFTGEKLSEQRRIAAAP